MPDYSSVVSPTAAVVVGLNSKNGNQVRAGEVIAVLEAMKLQIDVRSPVSGLVEALAIREGDSLQKDQLICRINPVEEAHIDQQGTTPTEQKSDSNDALSKLNHRIAEALDEGRAEATAKRHKAGYRTARENLADLCDEVGDFVEYGQLAVAAQRQRLSPEELKRKTAADGIITGLGSINAEFVGQDNAQTAIIVNDYSVLAGSQGYFHHKKLDRILEIAKTRNTPVIMYTEGGGGRPGDTDVLVSIAGLNVTSFSAWAELGGQVPRIAVNNGYCFAGNAALFGCADICIATRSSWIGMAGPAMIEGGGLGKFAPTDIGPIDTQSRNGVVDLVAEDEADATAKAKQILSYFQGDTPNWNCADQEQLWPLMPKDRTHAYQVRDIINTLVDTDSFIELRREFGCGIVTGFMRIEGKPMGLIANDCQVLGGAIDAEAAVKATRFMTLCGSFNLPILSLCDTPGFMVGPDSETHGSVRKMSDLFLAGAKLRSPLITIFLRKAYGLGAMAMAGGSFVKPVLSAAWPSGEFGAMGLEGAVRLGFKKELEAKKDAAEKERLYEKLVADSYERGKATEAAAYLEIDAVIDPRVTREFISRI